jgi:integrase
MNDIYQRVTCGVKGSCNRQGPDGTCSKCGKHSSGGTWWIRFRFGGRLIHESTKTASKTLARDAARQRRRELETKWNRVEKRKLPPTLTEASARWLEKRSALSPGTQETYAAALKNVKKALGAMVVCEISARHIESYQRKREEHGAAGATINKEIACLSSILAEYGLWDALRRDVKRAAENESAGRALSAEEEKWLLACASNVGQHQGAWTSLYTVTVLALNTGLRHTEIRRLKWKNLDLANRLLRVGESKTDAGRGRPIPLTQPAWAVLEMWSSRFTGRTAEHYVFPACENGRVSPERPIATWRTAWRRVTRLVACPACGRTQSPASICEGDECKADMRDVKSTIAGLRFHDLRHTAATKLLENGAPFAVVAQILGWSASTAVRMAKRYGHIRPEVQRRALDGITTAEIAVPVHQIVNQPENALLSQRRN